MGEVVEVMKYTRVPTGGEVGEFSAGSGAVSKAISIWGQLSVAPRPQNGQNSEPSWNRSVSVRQCFVVVVSIVLAVVAEVVLVVCSNRKSSNRSNRGSSSRSGGSR